MSEPVSNSSYPYDQESSVQPHPDQAYVYAPAERTPVVNVKSVLALFFSWSLAPVGLILGILALKEIKRTGSEGRAFALTAVIVSSIAIVFAVLYLAFVILVIATIGAPPIDDPGMGGVPTY